MNWVWKLAGALLIPFVVSCSSTMGVTKKDATPEEKETPTVRRAARALCSALGQLPPETELCSCSPARDRKTQLASIDKKEEKVNISDVFSGRRNPRVPDLKFPVPSGVLSSPFGYRGGVFHSGLDIAGPMRTPILCCADGTVVFAGVKKGRRSYGRTVLVDHGRDVYTHYAHLSKCLVKPGQKVHKGDQIALLGNTGRTTSPHLHLEVKVGPQFYNPYPHFAPSETRDIEVARGLNLTPMGPVRVKPTSMRK